MLIDFRELFPRYNIKPKGVLHVGGNVGEEIPVYFELGIDRQIWIEANEEVYQKLLKNLEHLPRSLALNNCISDRDGEYLIFHISNNGSQSSSILELGTHSIVHPDVYYVKEIKMKARRIDKIFSNGLENIDFLNIDLQGAELKALKGMGELLHQFKWAYLEVNKEELYKGCALIGEIDSYMLGFGFRRVETKWCGNTGWGDALYIK